MRRDYVFAMTLLGCVLGNSPVGMCADWPQWRGPNRDTKSAEVGLLKKWPGRGPGLLWSTEGLGRGFSSVAVSNGRIYVTGSRGKESEVLFAYDMDGKLLWKREYGPMWTRNFQGARTTPAVDDGLVYVISSLGRTVCMDAETGSKKWQVDGVQEFGAEPRKIKWGIAESPLIVDDKVIFTPGGSAALMVALDKKTGRTIWTCAGDSAKSAFCSPLLVDHGGRKIIVTAVSKYVIGVDPEDGSMLWKYPFKNKFGAHPNTPVYSDGMIYVTAGYDYKGIMLGLSDDGTRVALEWEDETLDTHHGNVVLVDGYIYGASWDGNRDGNWVCLELKTGKVMYETKWKNKGSLTYADGMLYCYAETGDVCLVKADPSGFKPVSSFKVEKGEEQHWAHPVVCGGRLYIRHGDALMVYDVKG